MKVLFHLPALASLLLTACEMPPAQDGSSYYYASSAPAASNLPRSRAGNDAPLSRDGYAPGSGPTAMPRDTQFMHQQKVSGPFGSRSASTVIQSSGNVQSYQTIGGVPVYPGAGVPGYIPNQPYLGAPASRQMQPTHFPGSNANPGYFLDPRTGAWVRP